MDYTVYTKGSNSNPASPTLMIRKMATLSGVVSKRNKSFPQRSQNLALQANNFAQRFQTNLWWAMGNSCSGLPGSAGR